MTEVDPASLDYWNANIGAHELGISLIKPGVTCAEITSAINSYFLEIDLLLQRSGLLAGHFANISNRLKMMLYSILFAAAAYWGLHGDFLDFWDSFLWLIAFVFIERNLFHRQAQASADSAG